MSQDLEKEDDMRKIWFLLVVLLALLMTVGSVAAGGRPLSTTLSGANEIAGGDPDGSGTARITLNQGQGEVCFEISVANLDEPITRAHIHAAPASSNGPIVAN